MQATETSQRLSTNVTTTGSSLTRKLHARASSPESLSQRSAVSLAWISSIVIFSARRPSISFIAMPQTAHFMVMESSGSLRSARYLRPWRKTDSNVLNWEATSGSARMLRARSARSLRESDSQSAGSDADAQAAAQSTTAKTSNVFMSVRQLLR
eukprot:Amastigsp_a174796_375.p3 type:complete len:154 gc:universal Amastigsp_a174796_375:1075-1536(+)